MMQVSDFTIGREFWTAQGKVKWRCTDVGSRTVIAIQLDCSLDPSWFAGPPYAVAEHVFDEFGLADALPVLYPVETDLVRVFGHGDWYKIWSCLTHEGRVMIEDLPGAAIGPCVVLEISQDSNKLSPCEDCSLPRLNPDRSFACPYCQHNCDMQAKTIKSDEDGHCCKCGKDCLMSKDGTRMIRLEDEGQ